MKRIVLLIASVAGLTAAAHAQPAYMNYQGRLLDAGGQPLTNGTYTLQFDLYDSPNGTNRVWGHFLCDDGSGAGHAARAVVANGRFNVILGPTDTAVRSLTDSFQDDERFVEIRVNGGDPILPRQQILSAPYALQSSHARLAQLAERSMIASNLVQQVADTLCPPGTIVAFGGGNVPSGWLRCDGSAVASTNYSRLFAAIVKAWGDGSYHQGSLETPANPGTDFNLPDLRGMFLRGVNGGRSGIFGDPDYNGRGTGAPGGLTGNNVGSVQDDALQNVTGTIGEFNTFAAFKGTPSGPFSRSYAYGNTGIGSGSGDPYDSITMDLSKSARTSTETRPNNAYVNYIIKY